MAGGERGVGTDICTDRSTRAVQSIDRLLDLTPPKRGPRLNHLDALSSGVRRERGEREQREGEKGERGRERLYSLLFPLSSFLFTLYL